MNQTEWGGEEEWILVQLYRVLLRCGREIDCSERSAGILASALTT